MNTLNEHIFFLLVAIAIQILLTGLGITTNADRTFHDTNFLYQKLIAY